MILFILFACLSGCTPSRYEDKYAYTPPSHELGKSCIEECSNNLAKCLRIMGKDYIEQEIENFAQEPEEKDFCYQDYRDCYELCGGEILVKRFKIDE